MFSGESKYVMAGRYYVKKETKRNYGESKPQNAGVKELLCLNCGVEHPRKF